MCESNLHPKEERHSIGCHHYEILVDNKEKTMTNNEYKIKQNIILM